MTFDLLSILFFILAGASDAMQTLIRDDANNTLLRRWIGTIKDEAKRTKYINWYHAVGGNARWNPSLPSIPFIGFWSGDAWHTFKFGWIYSMAITISFQVVKFYGWWYFLPSVWLFQMLEGNSFRIFYGIIWRVKPSQTLWQLLTDWNPFINTHKK